MEAIKSFSPETTIDQVIPLGNKIVDRTAAGHAADEFTRVAKGGAAVHAACALGLQILLGHGQVKLIPVANAIFGRDF